MFLLKFYKKFVSPLLVVFIGPACRHTPTCSEYSMQAVEKYGIFRGLLMGAIRILRCNPFTKPGYDPLT